MYHPEWLRRIRKMCDRESILLIADEIATGFGRTANCLPANTPGSRPTFCVWESADRRNDDPFRHPDHPPGGGNHQQRRGGLFYAWSDVYGQSAGLRGGDRQPVTTRIRRLQAQVSSIEAQLRQELTPAQTSPWVADVRVLGAIGVVETTHPVNMAALQKFFVRQGVWIRPFGKLIYLMPPYLIQPEQLRRLTQAVNDAVRDETFFNG